MLGGGERKIRWNGQKQCVLASATASASSKKRRTCAVDEVCGTMLSCLPLWEGQSRRKELKRPNVMVLKIAPCHGMLTIRKYRMDGFHDSSNCSITRQQVV